MEIMYKVLQTKEFANWLSQIKDLSTYIRLSRRLDKARLGNLGDVKSLSGGLYEMREHFGAGWRMYFVKQENLIILMLGAGDKSTQPADIKNIRQIIKRLEE